MQSRDAYTSSTATTVSDSGSKFALGINAAFDIAIVGPLFATLVPEYVIAVGSGSNIGVAAIRAGVGFAF